MKVLVTGSCGLLGAHVMTTLASSHELMGLDRHPWWGAGSVRLVTGELTGPGFIEEAVRSFCPELVIHCAALVSVDACERNPSLAERINVDLTRRLVRSIPPACRLIYISTDGLFKGDRPFSTEQEPPCPRTVYARTKLQGEWEVQLASKQHLIVRTNFYGWSSGRKQTAAEWLVDVLEGGKPVTLFRDFFFTPIYIVDLVERLEALIELGERGLFHLCGRERVSKSQFATLLAQEAGFSLKHVRLGSIDEASLAVSRPKDMSLASQRFEERTGLELPDCRSGIKRFLRHRNLPLNQRFDPALALEPTKQGSSHEERR